jgi:hypothetical protein
VCRASTSSGTEAKKDVEGRDKPGHDGAPRTHSCKAVASIVLHGGDDRS